MDGGSIGLGFLAGLLSTLSPCVLPLLPLVLGGAVAAHRHGVAALTAGLVVSFVGIGLFVATLGFSIGLDGDWFRRVSAVLLAGIGLVLLSGRLQERLAVGASGVEAAGDRLLRRLSPGGVSGQFLIGLVLGAAWSPCVGPTLGAASLLAAQGRDLGTVALVMAAFGVGTAVPLLAIGLLSREALRRWRGRLADAGRRGRQALGALAVTIGALVLTGYDRPLEALLVAASPAWLTGLTTRF
jgi:cytochrome c biogenesis protein CcdA